VFAGSSSESNP